VNLTAEQAHLFLHHVLLGVLTIERRKTKSVIAAVPNRNLDYRPDAHAKTANELLRHIAAADNFYLRSVIDGVFVPGTVTIPESIRSPVEVAEWYEQTYASVVSQKKSCTLVTAPVRCATCRENAITSRSC
jgi:hypothetical protein